MRLRLTRRLLRRFSQIDNRHRLLRAEAVLGLVAARVALIFVPFPRLARWLGTLLPSKNPRIAKSIDTVPDNARIAKEVRWAVTRVALHVPFKCLPQAMAAHAMLKRRGVASVTHIGVNGETASLKCHAWLDAAGVEVTGYPLEEGFTEIACFV